MNPSTAMATVLVDELVLAGVTGLLIAAGAFFWFNQRHHTTVATPVEDKPAMAAPTGTVSVSAKAKSSSG